MITTDWIQQLRREASAHGMCQENRIALNSIETKSEAIALYKKTIDWALEEGYPKYTTLLRDFSDCDQYGLFINREFHGELLNAQAVYVFHNCTGRIRTDLNLDAHIIPMLYFANGCDMTILPGEGGSNLDIRVPLYIFGENNIKSIPSECITFRTYKFDVK